MILVKYFAVQIKRMIKHAASVLPIAMLLFSCIAAAVYFFFQYSGITDANTKYRIGIVGNTDQTYLKFGFYAIGTMDVSKYMVDFIPMTEEEAKEEFRAGTLTAYVVVPDEFLDSVVHGRNDVPITYVSTEGHKGIEGYLMDEFSVVISDIVTSSQASIYSMQSVARSLGKNDELGEWTEELNLRLIGYVLNRTDFAELEELGISKGLLIRQYYFCTMILLFCFLLGISSAPLFSGKNDEFGKWMKMRGIGPFFQVVCEYFAYFILMLICVYVPLAVLGRVTDNMSFLHKKVYPGQLFFALFPIMLMICAFHFMIYETVRNTVSNLLVQFVMIMGMGYVSGFFLPADSLPESISAFGRILPSGVTMDHLSGMLFTETDIECTAMMMIYSIIFLMVSVMMRRWIVMRSGE